MLCQSMNPIHYLWFLIEDWLVFTMTGANLSTHTQELMICFMLIISLRVLCPGMLNASSVLMNVIRFRIYYKVMFYMWILLDLIVLRSIHTHRHTHTDIQTHTHRHTFNQLGLVVEPVLEHLVQIELPWL